MGASQKQTRTYSPEVTHLACLSGISNSEGQKMGAEQKRDCVKSSWGGQDVRQPSVSKDSTSSFLVRVHG